LALAISEDQNSAFWHVLKEKKFATSKQTRRPLGAEAPHIRPPQAVEAGIWPERCSAAAPVRIRREAAKTASRRAPQTAFLNTGHDIVFFFFFII